METKGLLVGAGLVLVGVILGFGVSTISINSNNGQPCCPKYGKDFRKDFPKHHFNEGERRGMRQFGCEKNFNYVQFEHLQEILSEELELTDEQQTKIDAIFAEHAKQRDARKQEIKAERDLRRQVHKAERDKMHAAILDVLDDSQDETFKTITKKYCRK